MTETTVVHSDCPIDWSAELDRNRHWMFKVLRSRVGDAHAAEDLLQEVALAVVRQPSRPTHPGKVAPWLYRLTVRQAINFHRRNRRRAGPLPECDAALAEQSATPLDWLMREERQGSMRRALQQAHPKDREILTLKYTENWTYDQIAEHMGVKPKTVEYRLLRAKKRLRRLLARL